MQKKHCFMDIKWPLNTVESSTFSKSQTIEANFLSLLSLNHFSAPFHSLGSGPIIATLLLCTLLLFSKDSPFSFYHRHWTHVHTLLFFHSQHVSLQFVGTHLVLGAEGPNCCLWSPSFLSPSLQALGFSDPFSGILWVFSWFTVSGFSDVKIWFFLKFFLVGLIELMTRVFEWSLLSLRRLWGFFWVMISL